MADRRRKNGFGAVIGNAAAPEGRAVVALAEATERSLLRGGGPAEEARRLATIRLVASLICERALAGRPLRSAHGPIARAARWRWRQRQGSRTLFVVSNGTASQVDMGHLC